MARPAPPTDVIKVAVSGTLFGHAWVNVFWIRVTTDGTRTINDLADLLDLVIAQFNTQFFSLQGSNVAGLTADGVWQTGPTTALADTRTAAHVGVGTTSVEDASASYVISWKIAARYRGGKPRTYLAGPGHTSVVNGSDIEATVRTALAANAVSFMAAINAHTGTHITSCELGTVSFFTAGGSETIPPTFRTPPVFEPYVGSGVRAKLGSQRRRILS